MKIRGFRFAPLLTAVCFAAASFGVFFGAAARAETAPLQVTSFSPQGQARFVRQVQATFSEPMVPLADGRAKLEPFAISCSTGGKARWLDDRTWLYEFEKDLPSSERCAFKLAAGLKALSGSAPAESSEFSFATGGPAIVDVLPGEGAEIEDEQYFRLALTGPVDAESIAERVAFVSEGLESPIGVTVLSESEAKAIWAVGYTSSEPGKRVVIKPNLRFPAKSKVKLVWGLGVRGPDGQEVSEEQTFQFTVRGPLSAWVTCERTSASADCVPMSPITVQFSASVPTELASEVKLTDGAGTVWAQTAVNGTTSNLTDSVTFQGPFPENAALTVEFTPNFRDDVGRPLELEGALKAKTAKYPPLVKFSAPFGIIERGSSQLLPVSVRNIEPGLITRTLKSGSLVGNALPATMTRVSSIDDVLTWLQKIGETDRGVSMFRETAPKRLSQFVVPRANGAEPLEVVGIPLEKPGFYAVEIQSPALGAVYLGEAKSYFVRTAALVTNLGVHLKTGSENSLVWVTALDTGAPVAGAAVTVADCRGKVLATGKSDLNGLTRLPPLMGASSYEYCGGRSSGVVAAAAYKDDFAFTLSSWNDGIELWRFDLPGDSYDTSFLTAHTVIAQSLVRRGDTVKMKHLIRRRTGAGLVGVKNDLPTTVRFVHYGTYEQFDQPLTWRPNGAAESEWRVPPGAKLGDYGIQLVRVLKDKSEQTVMAGSFRVEDFRIPLMRGTLALPGEPLVAPEKIGVTAAVAYLAGGAARKLPVMVRYKVTPSGFVDIPGYEGYALANGAVEEGRKKEEFNFDDGEKPEELSSVSGVLDDTGSAALVLDKIPHDGTVRRLTAELEYRDVAGFAQTVSTSAPVWPAETALALKLQSWLSRDSFSVEVAALSPSGERRAGATVEIGLFARRYYADRKRIVGGFYSYDSYQDVSRIDTPCRGETDSSGRFVCTIHAPSAGEFIVEARTTDAAGRVTASNTSVWVSAGGRQWFGGRDDDRIDIVPEKKTYEAGETARLQVRMPFDTATALVTVEREGIIEAFTRTLDSRDPVVEVPITAAYAPNVFVSVLVVRGRVGGVMPTALVDLGRPAYKFGLVPLTVGRKPHELTVTVDADKEVYRTRDKARVKIHAVGAADGAPVAGTEVAVAAVDEGILELAPNNSWDLLDAMMGTRGCSVQTATAQMHIVGRRHFGLKSRPPGGGGGKGPTRELFDALLYWNPRVVLDKNGEAEVEVPLNDSLTSFRIAAVASAGASKFGSGKASIRATQDLIVVPSFPPVVRNGDTVVSSVALRNTTAQPVTVTLNLVASDPRIAASPEVRTIGPDQSAEVAWRLAVPDGATALAYELEARADGAVLDRMAVTQRVVPTVQEQVYAATLRQVSGAEVIPVARPAEALPDRGGIGIALAARLGDGLAGVVEAMRAYPYTCLEQRVSRAIALGDKKLWAETMAVLPTYVDSAGDLKYFVSEMDGSSILTAYVVSIAAAAGWDLPARERGQMLGALRRVADGSSFGASGAGAVKLEARLTALEALTRANEDVGEIAAGLVVDPGLLSTSSLINWYAVLARTANVPNRAALLDAARNNLRARLNLSGSALGFSTESYDNEWWLMGSVDVNSVRLLDVAVEAGDWTAEAPRIAQGALGRQQHGAWDLTVANAWGTLAFRRFSERFEKTPVKGTTSVQLGEASTLARWRGGAAPAPLTLAWPEVPTDLRIEQAGSGAPWATVTTRAAIPLQEALERGYRLTKSYEPVVQRTPGRWSVGDIVRVKLDIAAQADRTWVVINDPIPPGAAIIGGGGLSKSLAADSTAAGGRNDTLYPTFEERTFEAYRAYFDFMPKGQGHLEYTVRLNTAGEFRLPEVRAEALYSPDLFGTLPRAAIVVEP